MAVYRIWGIVSRVELVAILISTGPRIEGAEYAHN
jgi:hypothetical protein